MENLARLALAVELLHSATLVHDDILDGDVFRRNALSVYAKWSVKEAILVGDSLASLALSLCRGYRDEVLDVMAYTCLQLSDGEYMDVELSRFGGSEKAYLEKVNKKSASLFKAAAKCGALAANGSEEGISALAGFGENFGVAFQIRDDVSDVAAVGNIMPCDINELRVTLPLIHLYQNGGPDVKALLKRLASTKKDGQLDKLGLSELLVSLQKSGSIRYCEDKIDHYLERAVEAIAPIQESTCKNYIVEMAQSLRISHRPNYPKDLSSKLNKEL
jgi:octaprenyl-diphosphate synthase